jgi:hypothetical protein
MMSAGSRIDQWRYARACLAILLLALFRPVSGAAQGTAYEPIDLPNGPAKPGFDVTRLRNAGNGLFQTFDVSVSEPLRKVLGDARVAEDTRLLVLDTAGGKLALVMDQMAFHHVAEGRAGNTNWLADF